MADNADTQQAYIRQALQKNVVDLRERSKQLTRENEQLKATRDKVEKDTHEFVAYFQKEMEKKDEVIAELRDQCRKLEYNLKTEVQRLTDKYEGMIQEQSTRAQRTDTELNEKLTAAEETLFALREFREHHNEVEQQIINLKTLLETKEREHAETITSSERKFIEDKARMDRAHKDQIEEFKRLAREDAQRGLDADTRRVVIDNRRMAEELQFQQQQTKELQRELDGVKERNRKLAREVELYSEKEKLYALQGHKRAKDNKELAAKVKGLEASLDEVVRDFEAEKQQTMHSHDQRTSDLSLELNGLRQLIKIKNKELKTMKRLASHILQQRTEVEGFFLDALEHVRDEIRSRRQEASKAATAVRDSVMGTAGFKLPALRPSSAQSMNDGEASALGGVQREKVDVKDLTWEDREKVLRLLFAKMNGVVSGARRKGEGGGVHGDTSPTHQGYNMQGPFGLTAGVPSDVGEGREYFPPPQQYPTGPGAGQGAGGRQFDETEGKDEGDLGDTGALLKALAVHGRS